MRLSRKSDNHQRVQAATPRNSGPHPSVLSRLHGEQPATNSIRILTIDGGGSPRNHPRGRLGRDRERTGQHPSKLFDVIAGTSTGSLLAMSMVLPGKDGLPRYQAAASADAYEEFAPKIFPRERWLQIRGLVHEKYSATGLERALKDFLGEALLSEALVHTLVPTYDLMSEDIHVFDSAQSAAYVDDDILMRHVVRGATAAPTYFDPFVVGPPISAHETRVDRRWPVREQSQRACPDPGGQSPHRERRDGHLTGDRTHTRAASGRTGPGLGTGAVGKAVAPHCGERHQQAHRPGARAFPRSRTVLPVPGPTTRRMRARRHDAEDLSEPEECR